MTHRLGVINQKGGVGKTTTAINLAASLALRGLPTLLVDLDPQGNATSGTGVVREEGRATIFEALLGQAPAADTLHDSSVPHLSVMPSDIRLIAVERELMAEERREDPLCRALDSLGDRFAYIVVDAPPSLGLLTLNILRAVRHLVIPVQSEYYALEGLSLLMETVESVRSGINPDLEILGLLMTMVDGRTNLARQVVEEVLRHFGDKVFRTVIARSVRLSEAPSHGQPVVTYDARCPASQAYGDLTSEVIARCSTSSNITLQNEIRHVQIHDISGDEMRGGLT